MNRDEVEGNGKQLHGSVKGPWGMLDGDQLGERDRLLGRIQEAYGISRQQAETYLAAWQNRQPVQAAPAK